MYKVKSNVAEFPLSFKDADLKQGIVMGYLSAFDVLDSDGDIVRKGAFAKTIAERGPAGKGEIRFLQDHDRFKVVGKFTELKEDSTGLYYEGKVGRHTAGQDFIKMVEDGIINQHSIGYRTIKQQKSDDGNILTEMYLYEGSGLQVDAANKYTPVVGVKSQKELADLFDILTKALQSGTYSDECYKTVIIPKYEEIKSIITKPSTVDTLPKDAIKSIINSSFKIYN